jgi:alpha-amylase/alpha-mannosidase (GH57 family)
MAEPIKLLLGVHAHQPVGNFDEVVADAHLRCYRPFLQTLYRFPEFSFTVHFSGWLLEVLLNRYPEDMALLQQMVARGQAEVFGGGLYEPVLASISGRDRRGQLTALSEYLQQQFGQRPQGAWLTERVWESAVVPALADSGIRYVTVDDYHLLCTGKQREALDSYYTTEEDERTLDVYPISEALRYRLPFAPADEAVAYLEQLAQQGQQAAIYFDDIEKFGVWPETYHWVYECGWLENFIRGVLKSPWIRTSTYQNHHRNHRTRGVIYLPTASYSEMNEWTLPPQAARHYAHLLHQEKDAQRFECHRPFLRGGIWRNFFSRYREGNWMHKRMLSVSQRLATVSPSLTEAQADVCRDALYRAQANDAYWHGLFGGLYLPHLRRSVFNSLIRLEQQLDQVAPRPALQRQDLDFDGVEELLWHNTALQLGIRLDGFAAVHELSSYLTQQNFGDTLSQVEEAYFDKYRQAIQQPNQQTQGVASAHDRVNLKQQLSCADLEPDQTPRAVWLDATEPGLWLDQYRLQHANDQHLSFNARLPDRDGSVSKQFSFDGAAVNVIYQFHGEPPASWLTRLELAMPSCDGYAGRYILADGEIPCGFGQRLQREHCAELCLDDGVLGGQVRLQIDPPAQLQAEPHFTVSQSEAGLEKIMQSASVQLLWHPKPGATIRLRLEVVPHPPAPMSA